MSWSRAVGFALALLAGAAARGDWTSDAPGVRRRIDPRRLPAPGATRSATNTPRVVSRPAGAHLRVPAGFEVSLFASGLENPRLTRVAPNGDVFVAETAAGRLRVLVPGEGGAVPRSVDVFAKDLDAPFGIAFHPPGGDPAWLYVATRNSVLRFPYRSGDRVARGRPEVIVRALSPTSGGHSTRDVVFSADGARMFVSVGSGSNAGQRLERKTPEQAQEWEREHGLGSAWGEEEQRADVLVFAKAGGEARTYATGLRNCVGMAIHPQTGDLWCSVNERDGLGDDLPPDFVTRVREGAFYGWPWYYIGEHEDPRLPRARTDLAAKVSIPDVLLEAHSAPLQMTFYPAAGGSGAFPAAYRGDGFVALHGSWNRSRRTGYKVIRVLLRDGVPTGEYEDFLTGFVVDDRQVWGRPVGVAVAADGALLVTEDGNGTIWRIARSPP